MERKKKAIIIMSIFMLSLFLAVTMIPKNSFTPMLPTNSNIPPTITETKDSSESYAYWWNISFDYRRNIIINNSLSAYDIINRPIDIFLTFNPNTCYNNSIRVQYWDGSSWLSNPIPYQAWNETYSSNYYQSLTITFYVNVSKNSVANYYIYYDDENQGIPSYPTEVTSSYASGIYTITGDYYTANLAQSQNGGKIYVSTHRTSGSEWSYDQAMDWSPEYRYRYWWWTSYTTSGHAANSLQLVEQGPLFIMFNISTNMASGSDVAGTSNIIYRFYRWGWTTETSTNFTRSFTYDWWRRGEYRGNELRFDASIMSEMKYEDSDGTVYQFSNFAWNGLNLGKAHWLCFYDTSDGEAAGTLDLEVPSASKPPYQWYYIVYNSSSSAQKWQRIWSNVQYTTGDWVYENYATYIWDGRSGSTPFENFAKSMRSTATIQTGDQETVRYTVYIQVKDYDGNPLPNANVSFYIGSTLNDSAITNSSGIATLYLYGGTYNLVTTWNETFQNLTTTIVWKTYTNTTTSFVVDKNRHDTTFTVTFIDLTSLYVHLVDKDTGNDFPSANISLCTGSPPVKLNDSQISNGTGWAVFHVDKTSYNINVTYAGTPVTTNVTSVDLTSGAQTLIIGCDLGGLGKPTRIDCVNGTYVESTWGDNAILKVYWSEIGGGNINSTSCNGYVSYTLFNYTSMAPIPGYVNISLVPMGSGSDVYYLVNLPYTVLFGNTYYAVHLVADGDGYLMAEKDVVLYVEQADADVEIGSLTGPYYWGQTDIPLLVTITFRSQPVTGATVFYSLNTPGGELKASHDLIETEPGYYQWIITNRTISTNCSSGFYYLRFTIQHENFTSRTLIPVPIEIKPAMTLLSVPSSVEGDYGDEIEFSVSYIDSVYLTDISDASISFNVMGTSVAGSFFFNESLGTFQAYLNSTELNIGVYTLRITARCDNYQTQETYIPLVINAIPTTLITPSFYLSSFVSPEIVYLGPFIKIENDVPFVIILVTYDAPSHSPVPDASVTVNGIPLTYIGEGNYMAIIPTYGLPIGSFPLLVRAEGGNYKSQELLYILNVNEMTVLIPLFDIRVPFTMFLAIIVSITIPVCAFSAYTFIKRARIPAIIKRIDELIKAISRGEKVTVKLVPRDKVIGDILREELAIVGIEPRVEKYIPVELADLIVPLLVESGMKEKEAYAMALELKTAAPVQREKLLESVGVSGETSARIIQTIEDYEEKQAVIRKPSEKETVEEESEEWERIEEESEEGERKDREPEDT